MSVIKVGNLFQDFSSEDESIIEDNLFQMDRLDESTGLNPLSLESLEDIVGGHHHHGHHHHRHHPHPPYHIDPR